MEKKVKKKTEDILLIICLVAAFIITGLTVWGVYSGFYERVPEYGQPRQ
jgi:hypothetical protein